MCGIAGLISKRAGTDLETIARRMAGVLAHRGPDDEGIWIEPARGLVLAHRRLSIIDLSPQGHQPMHSASGRYVLAFNGEIYNHLELRREPEMEKFTTLKRYVPNSPRKVMPRLGAATPTLRFYSLPSRHGVFRGH